MGINSQNLRLTTFDPKSQRFPLVSWLFSFLDSSAIISTPEYHYSPTKSSNAQFSFVGCSFYWLFPFLLLPLSRANLHRFQSQLVYVFSCFR